LQQNPNQQKAQQRRRRRCSSSVGVARNNNNNTHTSHNCKHPFAVAERNNSNTQTLKPQTLIDARLCRFFFFLFIELADEQGCKGEVDRVDSDLIW
jgi:hypothetical protein